MLLKLKLEAGIQHSVLVGSFWVHSFWPKYGFGWTHSCHIIPKSAAILHWSDSEPRIPNPESARAQGKRRCSQGLEAAKAWIEVECLRTPADHDCVHRPHFCVSILSLSASSCPIVVENMFLFGFFYQFSQWKKWWLLKNGWKEADPSCCFCFDWI